MKPAGVGLLALTVTLARCGPLARSASCDPGPGPACVIVTIPRGATLAQAVDSLVSRGLVHHRLGFTVYARLHGLGQSLKSGVYGFRPTDSWADLVAALALGRGTLVRFTVPEGALLSEIADQAALRLGVPRDSFLAAARDPGLLGDLGIGGARDLEGYLYPTTYSVRVHISGRELARAMVGEFLSRWPRTWDARLDSLKMTRQQIVTLASIVQAEVRYGPDRPYVSAVYHNRLTRGMLLQADPTVVYAQGHRLHRVYERHLAVNSPYNTYLYPGLPPGPICQPDSAALAAALYPARAPFLYFVAQPDGKHVFSVTYADHLKAIKAVQQQQQQRRTAAPERLPPGR